MIVILNTTRNIFLIRWIVFNISNNLWDILNVYLINELQDIYYKNFIPKLGVMNIFKIFSAAELSDILNNNSQNLVYNSSNLQAKNRSN